MEHRDTHDRFEDFIKKALEHYEEQPPESDWDTIRSRIPASPVAEMSPTASTDRRWRGLAAALVFLLASIVAGQYYYFSKQQQVLSEQLAQQSAVLEKTNHELAQIRKQTEAASAITASAGAAVEESSTNLNFNNQTSEVRGNQTYQKQTAQKKDSQIFTLQTSELKPQVPSVQEQVNTEPSVVTQIQPNIQSGTNPQTSEPTKAHLLLLPALPLANALTSDQVTAKPVFNRFTVPACAKTQSTLTFGAFTQVHATKQRIEEHPSRPGRPDDFTQQEYGRSGTEWQSGIFVQKTITDRLSGRIGLGYARQEETGQHSIRVKPNHHGGGPGGPGPGNDDSLSFNYTIQTGAGVADIEVRAVDQTNMTQNNDVDIKLTTTERIHSVVVPIGLDYRAWRYGRWSAHVQGTAVFGFPISKQLSIDNLQLNGSAPLQPEPRDRQRADYRGDRSGSFNTNAQIGLSLQYQISPRLAISVAPQAAYRLNKSLENGWAEQSLTSAGVQIGIGLRI